MLIVPLNTAWHFYFFDYTQSDTCDIGYRCPYCQRVYTQGRYGIEGGGSVMCEQHKIRCTGCDGVLPKPLLWQAADSMYSFRDNTLRTGGVVILQLLSFWPLRTVQKR